MSSRTYRRWCQINIKSKLIGLKPGQSKDSGTCQYMWFRNETKLPTMVGMLDIIKKELKKVPCGLHGQEISARLEMSPKKEALGKGPCSLF